MKRFGHVLLPAIIPLLLLMFGFGRAEAQCGYEFGEIPWLVPPAFAGIDGNEETFDPAQLYLGRPDGSIQSYTLDAINGLQQSTLYTPGNQLPASISAIRDISVPAPDFIVALVLYEEEGSPHYGVLRSEDGGSNWELVKPQALTDITMIEDDATRFQGNYWRAPMLELKWLPDGLHGWVWGRSAVLKTTDGGKTWTSIFTATNNTSILVDQSEFEAIWGTAFKDANRGVVLVGSKFIWKIWYTTDGGENWNLGGSPTSIQAVDVEWTGSVYRILRTDPFNFNGNNMQVVEDASGVGNDFKALATRTGIPNLGGLMTELLWPAHNIGFMVFRQGEFWKTDDKGKTWTKVEDPDPNYPEVPFGDGVDIRPRAGYGQKSIFIRDEEGRGFILQVLTDTCTGALRDPVIYQYQVDQFSSVSQKDGKGTGLELVAAPNPATEELELRFRLHTPAQVRADLVNAQGVVIKTVDFGSVAAGEQTRMLVLDGVASGAYHLVLHAGDVKGVESLIITK